MTTKVIRYRTHPDRADENQKLVEAVFQELGNLRPKGFTYTSVRMAYDTFEHTLQITGEADPLPELESFKRFQDGIAERCIDQPKVIEAFVVGSYKN